LAATTALMTRQDVIVVASVSAIYNLGSPKTYKNAMAWLKRRRVAKLQAQLVNLYYERNDVDFKRGTFKSVVEPDIHISYADIGVRVTFAGDTVSNWAYFTR
jgi:excinuclease ABC subunit B